MTAAAASATAAPHGARARAEFKRGVKAYSAKHFEAAAKALARSYALEHDPETLFAWAQTERKLGHCDKAVELYAKLLGQGLPAANKRAVVEQRDECKQILAAQAPATTAPAAAPSSVAPTPAATPLASASASASDAPAPAPDAPADAAPAPTRAPSEADAAPAASVTVATPPDGGRAWWRDPVGDGLVIAGAAGAGVGIAMLISSQQAAQSERVAATYDAALALDHQARSRGQIGVIASAAGGALLVTGIVWYATHRHHAEQPAVAAWLSPRAGGLTLAGRF